MSARPARFISARHRHDTEMGGPFFPDQYDDETQMNGDEELQIDPQAILDLMDWSDNPEMGNLLGDIGKGLKSVVKHPLTKMVAGGVAVAFPAVGVPLVAGIAVADQLVTAAEQTKLPKRQAAAKKIVKRTVAAAKAGDKDAGRAVKIITAVAKKKRASRQLSRPERVKNYRTAFDKQQAVKALLAKLKSGKMGLAGRPTVKGFLVTTLGRIQPGSYVKA